MYRNLLAFLFLSALMSPVFAQRDTIKLINPSFEDFPRNSNPPRGWYDCGFPGETPPDVQPLGGFNVNKPAFHGMTYLGMVVRDNETWEAVSQRLARPLKKEKCYEFSISLSRSEVYVSQSRLTQEKANYVTPVKLRIYGGNAFCNKADLLGETSLVINTRWLEYRFRFEPLDNYTFITFEAFYNTPTLFPYNGNILVDNASNIVEIPCNQPQETPEEEVAENTPLPESHTSKAEIPKINTPPSKVENEAAPKPKILTDLDANTLREGSTVRIDKLYFAADSSTIKPDSYDVLEEVYEFMAENPSVVVEIGGHTNTIPPHRYCDRLSTERAKAVAEYLAHKGISTSRLQYKGYGKRKPLTTETSLEGRKKNQRVEIKILSLNG